MSFAARRLVAGSHGALRAAAAPRAPARLFTTSALRFAAGPPVIQGDGAKTGDVATDEQQATGLERYELLGRLNNQEVFDMEPLKMTHLGTTKDPIKVQSYVSSLMLSPPPLSILDLSIAIVKDGSKAAFPVHGYHNQCTYDSNVLG